MPDAYIVPLIGAGKEVGDIVAIGSQKVEVIGREGIIHDTSLEYQVYVSEGELAGIADHDEVLSGCIVIAFTCGDHDPPCRHHVVYRQID